VPAEAIGALERPGEGLVGGVARGCGSVDDGYGGGTQLEWRPPAPTVGVLIGSPAAYAGAVHLGLVTIVVTEYDPAIRFFVDTLGFELVEDSPALTNDGRPKRWVVVRPPGAVTGLLLARADGDEQVAAVGKQAAGRVGFFLQVPDFQAAYTRMASAGVEFVRAPRTEPFGRVAVFIDVAGNKWDLIGPPV
jgi:catechol 2,3-dioxygenase-like lactoylglutathione lyase family enzyme